VIANYNTLALIVTIVVFGGSVSLVGGGSTYSGQCPLAQGSFPVIVYPVGRLITTLPYPVLFT